MSRAPAIDRHALNASVIQETAGYDYGHHFLFQGHEATQFRSYVTRINLDVEDPAHRITLLTPPGPDGKSTGFDQVDGSTWNPFSRTLLFTQESSSVGGGFVGGGVAELTASWPPVLRTLYGSIGRGDYEGIHPDDRGRIYITEDKGGPKVRVVRDDPSSAVQARQPSGFLYRFTPEVSSDLSRGRLEALQVTVDGAPLTFHIADPLGDVFAEAQRSLHTPGSRWPARWIAVHDTAVDSDAPFNANDRARALGATPFKRPENGQFLPGSGFKTFFFAPTGDTNLLAGGQSELAARGAWGAIFRLDLGEGSSGDEATLSLFTLGDREHTSFDNLVFADEATLLAAEDRGDTLHRQLNTLDSVWAYDVRHSERAAVRFVALGRDDESAHEAACAAAGTPTQNDADNEPTGLHVSEGDDGVQGMQGKPMNPTRARWFLTPEQQLFAHGVLAQALQGGLHLPEQVLPRRGVRVTCQ